MNTKVAESYWYVETAQELGHAYKVMHDEIGGRIKFN